MNTQIGTRRQPGAAQASPAPHEDAAWAAELGTQQRAEQERRERTRREQEQIDARSEARLAEEIAAWWERFAVACAAALERYAAARCCQAFSVKTEAANPEERRLSIRSPRHERGYLLAVLVGEPDPGVFIIRQTERGRNLEPLELAVEGQELRLRAGGGNLDVELAARHVLEPWLHELHP